MQWPTHLAEATCVALTDCIGSDLLADQLGGRDCATYQESLYRAGDLAYLTDSVAAGLVAFDDTQLVSCLVDIEELGCDVRASRLPSSCELAFSGLVEIGDSCTIHEDCAGSAFCDKLEDATCPGTCKLPQPINGPCHHNDDAQCEDGLVCFRETGECTPLGGPGAECGLETDIGCEPGLVCDGETSLCVALSSVYSIAEGEECDVNGPLCQSGLVCESSSLVTTAGVCRETVAAGASCKRSVPNQCPLDQYCDAAMPGEEGPRVDRPEDGEPCLNRSQSCADEHICICGTMACRDNQLADGTCLAKKAAGEECVASAQCYGGECGTDGTCTEALQCDAP